MKIKEKILNIFYDDEEDVEEEVSPKANKIKVILSSSLILNFILNVLFISFVCYRGGTKNICLIMFGISFIWTIISMFCSFNLEGKYSRYLFYINLLIILFLSKLWFAYF